MQEIKENAILSSILDKFIQQTEKGLEKYGHSVNPDELSIVEWITHFQEEMIDAYVYMEVVKQKILEGGQ